MKNFLDITIFWNKNLSHYAINSASNMNRLRTTIKVRETALPPKFCAYPQNLPKFRMQSKIDTATFVCSIDTQESQIM